MTDDYLRAFSGAVKHDSPNHYPSLKYRSGHHKPKGLATMTRDEAIVQIKKHYGNFSSIPLSDDDLTEIAESDLNIWTALGMLKLDEPKSAEDRFFESIYGRVPIVASEIFNDTLQQLNLKIVEK